MEILRIKVMLTDSIAVEGGCERAVMLPFTGSCEGPLFTGTILPGGVDTQRITPDGRCSLSARYALSGVDCEGKPCRLFIENVAAISPGAEMITRPTLRTDSPALRYLETADLTGRIEHFPDHIEIVLSSEDTAERKHIALQRGGLTLRGVMEKKAAGPRPLVLMLHGFGGCMDASQGLFQEISDRLTDAGFATLRFDFNGHGQSEGTFREMTPWNEIEDAAAFLRYAMALPEVTEISLLGHSQGGVIAGMLAGLYPDAVKKLVMLVPAASLKTDAIQGTCMGVKYDPKRIPNHVLLPWNRDVGGLYFRMAQALPIHETTARFSGPSLAIIGGRDCVVHPEEIRRYGEAMPDCRVIEMATLDHGLGGEERKDALDRVAAFLK